MLSRTYRDEISALFKQWPVWFVLAVQDIRLRYRRSSIGPFWITISMAVTIFSMGFLYSHLFNVDINKYFPYIATGIICWAFLSTLIIESTSGFIEAENYIRNQESFMTLFIMRILMRNTIIMLHNLLVFIPIMFIFDIAFTWNTLLFIPGALLIGINALSWGSLFALMGTRFRDVTQIITSLVQVVFFITPVMWMPDLLNAKVKKIVMINPFYHMLSLIREPLLGIGWSYPSLLVVSATTLLGIALNAFFLTRHKRQIVFWL